MTILYVSELLISPVCTLMDRKANSQVTEIFSCHDTDVWPSSRPCSSGSQITTKWRENNRDRSGWHAGEGAPPFLCTRPLWVHHGSHFSLRVVSPSTRAFRGHSGTRFSRGASDNRARPRASYDHHQTPQAAPHFPIC